MSHECERNFILHTKSLIFLRNYESRMLSKLKVHQHDVKSVSVFCFCSVVELNDNSKTSTKKQYEEEKKW
ncbi:CLUMA_CG011810, isoform A [Clunio marinus]|uniref:CLUMA_CG011810, isoform A n=1 Tax=Clunio marinus TaxID=568069 RepID=A0A1J1IDX7_9DIPT|nr:CLUMA_CG011810, isoform A [Clunio marinus]